jgi:serine phosphatase RsbU (regulator of sigma subunit)/anti-sigma regulatory factor (Ser/Thr protein kinase)/anti-anti-sigma regulatory factor
MDFDLPGPAMAWAFEHNPCAIAVCSGEDFTTVGANAQARRLFPSSDPVGAPVTDHLPAAYRGAARQLLDQVRRTGVPYSTGHHPLTIPRDDGGRTCLDLTLTPWLDPQRRVRGVMAFAVDVTALLTDTSPVAAPDEPGQASDLLTAMHDALLPATLPVLPTLSLAAQYVLAASESSAGGDWFDTVPLPDGRFALLVGDVAAQGPEAAALMSQLQSVARERLLSGADPESVLRSLDRYATHQQDASGATLCLAVLDPADGRLSYLTAGHPPPLVVDRHGGFRYLLPSSGGPLGTRTDYEAAGERLDHDELLVLYSDGLVDDAGTGGSTVHLAHTARELFRRHGDPLAPGDLDGVAAGMVQDLVDRGDVQDDATVLLATRTAPPEPLDLTGPADDESVEAVCERLAEWLTRLGARPIERLALVQACEEVLMNVVEHAYRDRADTGDLGLTASLQEAGVVAVRVADDGRWVEPDREEMGWGLVLAGGLVDRMRLRRTPAGTVVDLRHRLSRSVSLAAARAAVPLVEAPPKMRTRSGRVEVSGRLDRRAASRFRMALLGAAQAGLVPVVVDLSEVTVLTGVAVRELVGAVERGEAHGAPVTLVAAPGTPAQHVLELVAMPYLTREEAAS